MKTMLALITGTILASLPAYGRDAFPINRQFEVISAGHKVFTRDRMKVLSERPVDGIWGYTMMDVRVAPGCFNWQLRVKANPLGSFGPVIIRQTAVWCSDVTAVEKRLRNTLVRQRAGAWKARSLFSKRLAARCGLGRLRSIRTHTIAV